MLVFERPVLRNEAGGSEGGGGGSAAPAATPTALPTDPNARWAALRAGQQQPQQGQQDQAQEPQGWEAKIPKPKPINVADRIASKRERQAALPLQQELQRTQQQQQQLLAQRDRERAEYRRHMALGDVDSALKALGAEDYETIQSQYLRGKGYLPKQPADPHVQQLQRELQAFKQQQARQQQEAHQQQIRQQQQAQQAEELAAVSAELAQLPYEGAAELAQIPGVNESVLALMERNPELTLEEAAAATRRDYAAAFQIMEKAFRQQQQPQQQHRPQQSVFQQRMQQRAPSAAGIPMPSIPKEIVGDERWQMLRQWQRSQGQGQ